MALTTTVDLIDEDALHQRAVLQTGLTDFGDKGYLEGLRVLLGAARRSDRLEAIAERVSQLVTTLLASRLSSQAGWTKHPVVLEASVTAPLIITGIPRSGTTLLHFLMSLDPQFQWTPRWVGEAPLVRPPREEWENHPQYRRVHERLEATFTANPGLRAAHDMGAALADECITVMAQSFVSNMFISTLPLPEYREWFFQADEGPSYRRYRDNLQLIGAREPNRIWLLKNPSHTYGMEALLDTFPDARIIILHRNPVDTIASGASLTFRNASFWEKAEVGPIRLEMYSRAVERMAEARDRHPEANCFDIAYNKLVRDPLGAIRNIYARFGLTLTAATEQAMRVWIAQNPQGKHGAHSYSSVEFGITDDQVREQFAAYIERHDLVQRGFKQ